MKSRSAPLWVAALALVAVPVFAKNVATVNGKPVSQSRVDVMVSQMVANGQKDTSNLRTQVTRELILREALAQEARRKGIHKRAAVKTEVELMTQTLLINKMQQDYLKKHPVTDAQVKAEYNRFVKEHKNDKEYRVRHILVDKEAEAKAIVAKLKGGASFAALAKKSKDTGSAKKGGDLGWSSAERYVPPFAIAVKSLKKGQLASIPTQTRFGFHVIKLDDVRKVKLPELAKVKPQIRQKLQKDSLHDFQKKIIEKANIKPVK